MYKHMYNVLTVGGPEETLGTAIARSDRLPITDITEVVSTAAKNPSNVKTGRGTKHANYIDSIDTRLTMPLELQAIKGIGKLFSSCIGQDLATPQQVGGAFIISYTGDEASCKMVVTSTTVTVTIGDLGAEEADADFGTAGVYTFAALATDVAAIAAEPGYNCTKLFGPDALTTESVGYAITSAQISGNSAIVYFTSADSGVYLHRHIPVLTNTERPTLTFQSDGMGVTNDVLAGAVVDTIEISAELKGRASMKATAIGTAVTSTTASALTLSDKKPLKFANASMFLAGTEETFVKSVSISVANNHDGDEGYGTGSLYMQDHAKGDFAVTGSVSLRSGTTSEVEYAKRITDTTSSLLTVFQGDELATDIDEMVAVSVPYIDILSATKSAGGVGLNTELHFEAIDPQSYSDMFIVDMLTTDATKYN
jgi:hypothetical protein